MTVYAGKVNTAAVALTDMYSRPDGLSGPHMGSLFILRLLHTPSPTNHHVFCSLKKAIPVILEAIVWCTPSCNNF